jgi:hypothetical protein
MSNVINAVVGTGVGTGNTMLDGAEVGTLEVAIITSVVDGIVTTVTVDGTTDPGMNTGELGRTDTGGTVNEIMVLGKTGTGETVGTVITTLDGAHVGTLEVGMMTPVVEGTVIMWLEGTVEATEAGTKTGELGKIETGGNAVGLGRVGTGETT